MLCVLLAAYIPGIPVDWFYARFTNGDKFLGYISCDLVSYTIYYGDGSPPSTRTDLEEFVNNCEWNFDNESRECKALIQKITMYYIFAGLMGLAGGILGCTIIFLSSLVNSLRFGTLQRIEGAGTVGVCGCATSCFSDPCSYMFCQSINIFGLVLVGIPTLPVAVSLILENWEQDAGRLFGTEISQGRGQFFIYTGYEIYLGGSLISIALFLALRQLKKHWRELVFPGASSIVDLSDLRVQNSGGSSLNNSDKSKDNVSGEEWNAASNEYTTPPPQSLPQYEKTLPLDHQLPKKVQRRGKLEWERGQEKS